MPKRDVEKKVVKLLSLGYGYGDIASRVGLSEDEVKMIVVEAARKFKSDIERGIPLEVIAASWDVSSLTVDSLVRKLNSGELEKLVSGAPQTVGSNINAGGEVVGEKKRSGKGGVVKMSDDERSGDEEDEELETPSAAVLRRLLERSHVPAKTIDLIIEFFKDDYEHYESNPMALYNLLTGLDIKPNRARLIVEKFTSIVHGYNNGGRAALPDVRIVDEEEDGQMIGVRRRRVLDDGETVKDVKRSLREALDVMLYSTVLRQISSIQGSVMSPYQPNPFVSTIIEPIIVDGKVATDQYGMPMYRIIYQPTVSQKAEKEQHDKASDKGKDVDLTLFKELFSIQRDLFGKIVELNEKRYKDLEEQVSYALRRDPVEEVANKIDLLRRAGLISSGGAENKNIDFEKWKFEQELKLKQMEIEREDKWREREMSKESMRMIVDSLREAIATIGQPLAIAVGKGLVSGARRKPAVAERQSEVVSESEEGVDSKGEVSSQ